MKKADVYFDSVKAGMLTEISSQHYEYEYLENYQGLPVSLTMPVKNKKYSFDTFPSFFDGLLPEGIQLEGLLKQRKIDRTDYFEQLIAVGADLVGAISVKESK